VLATSVLAEQGPLLSLLAQLCHETWGVKEQIKRPNRWNERGNCSGRSVLAIRKDIHDKILAMHLAVIVHRRPTFRHPPHRASRPSFRSPGVQRALALKDTLVCVRFAPPAAHLVSWRRCDRAYLTPSGPFVVMPA
jgi:hypothetical protein